MDPATILALIGDLYAQLRVAETRAAQAEAELAKAQAAEVVNP